MSQKKQIFTKKVQQNEDMKFKDQSRPDPSVTRQLGTNNTPLTKIDFPNAPENQGFSNYQEFLASDQYRNAIEQLEKYTGVSNIGVGVQGSYPQLSMRAHSILQELIQSENGKEEKLIKLCERIMINLYPILVKRDKNLEPILDENGDYVLNVQFDFKLTGNAISVPQSKNKQEIQQQEMELAQDINSGELNFERARRRLENALTQGSAVDSTYVYEKFKNIVTKILNVDNIVEKYSFFVSIMMLGYWQFPEEMLSAASSEGEGGAGKTRVDTSTNPPTIRAEAIIFPFLIHEAIKGIQEYFVMPKKRKFKDEEEQSKYEKRIGLYQKAREIEDQVLHEIWDIRLGPALWRMAIDKFPKYVQDEKRKRFFEKILKDWIYANIFNLDTREFLYFFKEILQNSEDGKKLMGALFYDLSGKLKGDEVTKSTSYFKNEMAKFMEQKNKENSDQGLNDFLNDLGITLSEE